MKSPILLLAGLALANLAIAAADTSQQLTLDSTARLQLVNVRAEPVTLEGRRGLRMAVSDEAAQKLRDDSGAQQAGIETLVVVRGSDFSSGVIEAEIAGEPAPDAPEGARGFVGIAFRLQADLRTYDAFYLRPTNGRADDQLRRNHSTQYVSLPEWPWQRLRSESPGRYESYADLEPGKWTRVRIEVQGERARLYVNGQPQPVLVVNDLKTGATGRGAVALWSNPGTIAHFRSLRITTH